MFEGRMVFEVFIPRRRDPGHELEREQLPEPGTRLELKIPRQRSRMATGPISENSRKRRRQEEPLEGVFPLVIEGTIEYVFRQGRSTRGEIVLRVGREYDF